MKAEKISSTVNGANYTTTILTIKGNVWHIMKVTGKYNYVSVCKKTNNPYGGRIGKDFKNFDEAQQNYKCAELKNALLMIETGLI